MLLNSMMVAEPNRLTPREAEIVRLFCAGSTITEIAERLHRSVQTVSTQKRSAMRKLGVSRDVDLIKMYTGGVEFRCGRPFHRRGAVAPGFLASIPWPLLSRRPFRLDPAFRLHYACSFIRNRVPLSELS